MRPAPRHQPFTYPTPASFHFTPLARGTVNLEQSSSAWTGLVKIGTPAQEFEMYFDTGSTDMTVSDSTCTDGNCGEKARYSFDNSSTASDTGLTRTSSFADGTTSSGYVYEDVVRSGNLEVAGQTFLSATSLSSTVAGLDSDGIIGLGYTPLSATGTTSFPFTLYAKGLANSIQLRLSNTAGLSKIIFGKGVWASNYKGSMYWYAVSAAVGEKALSYWQVSKSSANVNGKRVTTGTGVRFIVDSGTTYIVAPTSGARKFYALVPGAKKYDANHWSFPCASAPTVSLSFGLTTKKLSIRAENFNLGYTPEDKTRCIGAVIAQDLGLGSSWVIGDSFLKSWYSVFDLENNRIGFATPNPL